MKYKYAVIGSGRQGAAAGYDLALRGDAESVILADLDPQASRGAALNINTLLKSEIASSVKIDASNKKAIINFLKDNQIDAFVSALPFYMNLNVAHAAIEAKSSMADLGGNTDIVFKELDLDAEAREAGITITPDCGMVPGLGTSLTVYAMEQVDIPEEAFFWDGGLPMNPEEPWNYIMTFHFEGLINEYFGSTEFLRDGKIFNMTCFKEYELIDFPEPFGQLEAFTSAGGTSSAPRSFLGKLKTYQNKTLRWKGHFAQWKAFMDAGLFETEEVDVKGKKIRPRDLLEAVLNPKIQPDRTEKDVAIIRSKCTGEKDGKRAEVVVDLYDYYDEATGYTAMERTTGFHAAMIAQMMARGETEKGAIPVEKVASGERIIEECKKRGMQINRVK